MGKKNQKNRDRKIEHDEAMQVGLVTPQCPVMLEAAGCDRHSRRRDIKTTRKAPERTGGKQIAWGAAATSGAAHDRFGEIRQQIRPQYLA